MTLKVCVVTGSRAEYGLLRWVLQGLKDDPHFSLQIVTTGSHLLPEFGSTYRAIEEDGFIIDQKVCMPRDSDSPADIVKSTGICVVGFGDALRHLEPDLVVLLGDRFEILAASIAALIMQLPIAHLHGGEITEGSIDDSMRHAITKMSHVHFVATEAYRRRVIQLGEAPDRVHCVGGLGVDVLKRTQLLSRSDLEKALEFKLKEKNLLVTFHPTTISDMPIDVHLTELLAALSEMRDTGLIFTLPNADAGGHELGVMLLEFVAKHSNARAYASLGQLLYLSCMAHCNGVVGNSSSGLLEAPTLKKGTINIGDRQRGRIQAESVINCDPERNAIKAAINTLYSPHFQSVLQQTRNPYGNGGASERIVDIIRNLRMNELLRKSFHDLPTDFLGVGL